MPADADPDFQLEIDECVLDYLMYTAIFAVLEDFRSPRVDVDQAYDDAYEQEKGALPLQLVDSFLAIFRAKHPGYHGSEDLRFRLRLLQFTVMFTKRAAPVETTPSIRRLHRLRYRRKQQAQTFRSKDEDSMKLDLPDLTEYTAPPDNIQIKQERFTQNATQIGQNHGVQRSPPPAVSLLDTLPFFMALSAAHNATRDDARVTNVWMLLAAGYMAQATMEQYLIYGARRSDLLQDAFTWGFDAECGAEPNSDEWRINAMFWGDDEVIPGWDRVRDEHWQILIPLDGTDLQEHFHNLMANSLPFAKFEMDVTNFLGDLLNGQPKPLLAQLGCGKMDGLSRKETRALQDRIGIP